MRGLVEQGRLDRALRVMRKANALCRQERWRTWAEEVAVLGELGLWAEMREVADEVDARGDSEAKEAAAAARQREQKDGAPMPDSDEAKGPMRQAYEQAVLASDAGKNEEAYELYRKAWELWHPNGQALMQAGLMAGLVGKKAEAQRLFDRAVVELEKVVGERLVLDTTDGFSRPLEALAWHRDTGAIAVAHDRYVSVLSQANLREQVRLEGHQGLITSVAFSRDGKKLASVSWDQTVRLWEVGTGRSLATLQGHTEPVTSVAFSPDGKKLASGARDDTVRLWEVGTGRSLGTLKGHSQWIGSVAFSPDGKKLASG